LISIIIPVYRDADALARTLAATDFADAELIVSSASADESLAPLRLARPDIRWVDAPRGRARQMNAGAHAARGSVLLFLHADTLLPAGADALVARAIEGGAPWGRFDVAITGADPLLRVIACSMNARSRWSAIATGDQAIFVKRDAFQAAGGFPDIPLMEDVALSRALKRAGRPACLRERVVTSGRRWERRGTLRTIFLMWRLRLAYAAGADPSTLSHRYDA